jgi:hypothetical protein
MASRRKLPQSVARLDSKQDFTYLAKIEKKVLSIDEDDPKPYIVLKYFQPTYQCFSMWNAGELRSFSDLIQRMRQIGWSELAGRGALGFKIHKYIEKLPQEDIKCLSAILSPDITFSEIRVTKKARIHGFRAGAGFYLVWLDKDHEIFPMS